MKKNFKYIWVVLMISLINYLLWIISKNDCLAQKLHEEFSFDIILRNIFLIFISILGLLILRLITRKFKQFDSFFRNKIILTTAITLVMFSSSTSMYIWRILTGVLIKTEFRAVLCDKISTVKLLAYGSMGRNLDFKEYNAIRREIWFPKVPKGARSINYEYSFDGFLPDYFFVLTYTVDKDVVIKIIDIENKDWSKSQQYEIKGEEKIVTYSEMNH